MKNLKNIVKKLIALILPNRCLSCNQFIAEDAYFCEIHNKEIEIIEGLKCEICSDEIKNNNKICENCQNSKPSFDYVSAVFKYNDEISKVIFDLKYYDKTFLRKRLGEILVKNLGEKIHDFDIITPVPLHKKRLKERKFNQGALLCKEIKKFNKNLQFLPNLLLRTKYSKAQARLSQQERMKNLKNSFAMNKKFTKLIENKKILLVDDVMTTGSTLQNCAKILKENGAQHICVLVIAKTILD